MNDLITQELNAIDIFHNNPQQVDQIEPQPIQQQSQPIQQLQTQSQKSNKIILELPKQERFEPIIEDEEPPDEPVQTH